MFAMIASIQGRVATIESDSVVIVVNGIGYQVFLPNPTDYHHGEEIALHTHLIVREDSLTLFGFSTISEREIFETLLKVNGVGPRLGLAILTTMTVDSLRNAVFSDRAELLTRVPGIGKKTAQKIVFDLKDKLKDGLDTMPIGELDNINTEVMDVLIALGYSIVEAQTALQSLPKDAPDNVEDRVRLALQNFA
jgi:Holliday junction DNA helicase RuvA